MNINFLKSIWKYKDFILASVKREFQSKYQNSLLGASWTILNPLAMVFVYTVIFSQVMRAKIPGVESTFSYSIYLCSGILTWGLFAELISRGQNIFLENANILKKLNFPRITLPIIMTLNASLNFAIIFSLFMVFLIFSGNFTGWLVFTIIPVLIVQLLFSVGLGLTLGVLNVFFRDIGQLFSILLQFWFWLTPIVYPATVLPEAIRHLVLTINPLAPIIASYQTILVNRQPPEWSSLIFPLLLGLLFCLLAIKLFRKHANEIVDEL